MNHEDEIRLIAYRIWEEEGCPDGLHHEHWVRAETVWREQFSQTAKAASARAKARKPDSPATATEPSWLKAQKPKPSAKKKRSRPQAKSSKR
jgi:hypothetical protein